MKYLDIIINESIMYRGIGDEFSQEQHDASHIIFVTPDYNYASTYGKVQKYDCKLHHGFKLGFRTLQTEVSPQEFCKRIQAGIIASFEDGNISKDKAVSLFNTVRDISKSSSHSFARVFTYYMNEPIFSSILVSAGYDYIECKEGPNNSITTYGILVPSNVKPCNKYGI